MPDIQSLNSEQHRNLRVITRRGAEFGDATHIVPVLADELGSMALEYPIVFVKNNEAGGFGMCAMLGFEAGENLYLDGDTWDASYIPVNVRRQPFSLTYTAEKDGKPDPQSLVISMDMDSKRIQEEEGERLFEEDGSQTEYMKGVAEMLAGIGPAALSTEVFVKTLVEQKLIEPANLDVQFADGEKKRFEGIYSLRDDTLGKLEGEVLADLYKRGYLQAAWLILASLGNIRRLLLRKAKRTGAAAP